MSTNQITITRQGVPIRVASWFKTLTPEGKRMIGTNNIMAKPSRHARQGDGLTDVEYVYSYADGSPAHADQEVRAAIRQREAERARAIAAYEAGHLKQKPEPERIAA